MGRSELDVNSTISSVKVTVRDSQSASRFTQGKKQSNTPHYMKQIHIGFKLSQKQHANTLMND